MMLVKLFSLTLQFGTSPVDGHVGEVHLLHHAPDGDEQQREPLNSAQLPLEEYLKRKYSTKKEGNIGAV